MVDEARLRRYLRGNASPINENIKVNGEDGDFPIPIGGALGGNSGDKRISQKNHQVT